jgi:hypothetical protein
LREGLRSLNVQFLMSGDSQSVNPSEQEEEQFKGRPLIQSNLIMKSRIYFHSILQIYSGSKTYPTWLPPTHSWSSSAASMWISSTPTTNSNKTFNCLNNYKAWSMMLCRLLWISSFVCQRSTL